MRIAAGVGAAWLATAGALVQPAHAVPAPPPAWALVNADAPMVANGVLLFELNTYGLPASDSAMSVMVAENTGAEVTGAVETLALTTMSRFRIFRPANALTSGSSYVATAATGAATNMMPFMATGAAPSGAPEVTLSDPRFDIQRKTIDQTCCEFQAGARGPQPCVVTEAQEQAMLSFKATWANPSAARQFLYRLMLTDPAPAAEHTYWRPARLTDGMAVTAEREADEYCYRIEAFGLIDGVRHVLKEACAPNALPPLARVEPTANEIKSALDISRCGTPPMEFADAWCEQNRVVCSGAGPQSPCIASDYAKRCSGSAGGGAAGSAGANGGAGKPGSAGAPGTAGSHDTGGSSGNGDRAGTGGAGREAIGGAAGVGAGTGADEGDDDDDDAVEHRTSGCGCRVGASPRASGWFAASVLAAVAYRLRMRRRRPAQRA